MKTPEELAQEGRVVEAFDSILSQEVPPEELAKRGMVKEAYDAILAAKDKRARKFDVLDEIGKRLSNRRKEIEKLEGEIQVLKTLRAQWPVAPEQLVSFDIVSDAQLKAWLAPIEAFQKLVDQHKLRRNDMTLLDLAAEGKRKSLGEERYFALKSEDLRRLGKLVKTVRDDNMEKYREGYTPVEISPEGKKLLKLRVKAQESPMFVNKHGYQVHTVGDQGSPIEWSA